MRPLLLVTVLAAAAAVTAASPVAAQARLTSASNVRLRALPSADAAIIAELALGSALQQSGAAADGAWLRVRTTDGREGWIAERLTRQVGVGAGERVAEEIIRQRVAREADGFQAYAELVSFAERMVASASTPELAGRFALYRLQALQRAAVAIPFARRTWSRSLASWVDARQAEIDYDEPGGEWMVSRDAILAEHDRRSATGSADEIAWLAALNGVPGECEGHLACYLERADLLEGEYLRREPRGRHVAEAIDRLREFVQSLVAELGSGIEFDPARDCRELAAALASLRAAATRTGSPGVTPLLDNLDRLARLCPNAH